MKYIHFNFYSCLFCRWFSYTTCTRWKSYQKEVNKILIMQHTSFYLFNINSLNFGFEQSSIPMKEMMVINTPQSIPMEINLVLQSFYTANQTKKSNMFYLIILIKLSSITIKKMYTGFLLTEETENVHNWLIMLIV